MLRTHPNDQSKEGKAPNLHKPPRSLLYLHFLRNLQSLTSLDWRCGIPKGSIPKSSKEFRSPEAGMPGSCQVAWHPGSDPVELTQGGFTRSALQPALRIGVLAESC